MDPIMLLNMGIALARAGVGIWGDIKKINTQAGADGEQTVEFIIGVRPAKLAEWLTQVQSDQAQTLAEIERRKALPQ